MPTTQDFREINRAELNHSGSVLPQPQRAIVLGLLIGVVAFAATLEGNPNLGQWLDWDAIWTAICYFAAPCLLAMWGALSSRPLSSRLPEALGLAALLGLAIHRSANWHPETPVSPAVLSVAFYLVTVLLPVTVFSIPRRWRGWRFELENSTGPTATMGGQFTLQRCLAWIAFAAVVFALARGIDRQALQRSQDSDWQSSLVIWLVIAIATVLISPCILSCTRLILGRHNDWSYCAWALAAIIAATAIVCGLWTALMSLAPDASGSLLEAAQFGILQGISWAIGFFSIFIGSLLVLRLCGYRLVRNGEALAEDSTPETLLHSTLSSLPSRRLSFASIVAALLLVAAFLCWPAWLIQHDRQQTVRRHFITERFKELGLDLDRQGTIRPFAARTSRDLFPPRIRPQPSETISAADLGLLAEIDQVKPLTIVDLTNRWMSDDLLRELPKLDHLRILMLSGSGITDAGVKHLRRQRGLTNLCLHDTQITDAGLKEICQLDALIELDLSGGRITDAGLEHSRELKQLAALRITDTAITDAGLAQLRGLGLLDVSGTRITASGLKSLQQMTQLQIVTLPDSTMASQALTLLRQSTPQHGWTRDGAVLIATGSIGAQPNANSPVIVGTPP